MDERDQATARTQLAYGGTAAPGNPYPVPELTLEDRPGYPFRCFAFEPPHIQRQLEERRR